MPDKQIADYLRQYCKGEYRAVTSRELKTIFGIRSRELRGIVNRLRGGVPICSAKLGYFYAGNEQELSRTIQQLTSRIKKIAAARRGLISAQALITDDGQTRLPLGGDSLEQLYVLDRRQDGARDMTSRCSTDTTVH